LQSHDFRIVRAGFNKRATSTFPNEDIDALELHQFRRFVIQNMHRLAKLDAAVSREFEVEASAARPGASVIYVTGQTLLATIEVDGSDALASLQHATATCRATVDFPEPPFSLPRTTTRLALTCLNQHRSTSLEGCDKKLVTRLVIAAT
jgi:hypothetical protein